MRERQCGKIGRDKAYSSGTDCLRRVQNEWHGALSTRQCRSGVSEAGLRRCLRFVRVQDCRDRYSQETLDNQCRADQICVDQL